LPYYNAFKEVLEYGKDGILFIGQKKEVKRNNIRVKFHAIKIRRHDKK